MWDKRLLVLLAVGLYACGGQSDDDPANATAEPDEPPARTQPASAPVGPIPASLPGVDDSALSDDEKRAFHRIVDEVNSPCGAATSIARCVREGGAACPDCRRAARYAVRLLGEGYPADGARELVRLRFGADTAVELSTEGCAFRGSAMARVTIVEFADFECPHCRQAHETFDQLFADAEIAQSARLCYRFFPLTGHENARPAAQAAVAAMNQGKFWEMATLLYHSQASLSPAKYLEFAAQIGLDRARFTADLALPATDARVQRDRDEGERVEIEGTPAIFVNGRRYEASPDLASLRTYIREELER